MKTWHTYFLFLIILLLNACQQITPLTPSSPIVGVWTMGPYQISDLPSWYVAKIHADSVVVSPTYTVYSGGILAISQNVHSYTFTADGSFSEIYEINGGISDTVKYQTDHGTWVLNDTLVSLTVANSKPHKLLYFPTNTNQLSTGLFRQTAIIGYGISTIKPDTVSYTIRLLYNRQP